MMDTYDTYRATVYIIVDYRFLSGYGKDDKIFEFKSKDTPLKDDILKFCMDAYSSEYDYLGKIIDVDIVSISIK